MLKQARKGWGHVPEPEPEPEVDFCDDKPIFDWNTFRSVPAKSWRYDAPRRPKPSEMLSAAVIALGLAVVFFVVIVLCFV